MIITTYRWDPIQDILDTHELPLLSVSHPYVNQYRKWAYTINTAQGFYRKADITDDLILYDGKNENIVFRHVTFYPCKRYHDLLFLHLRGPNLYYVLDSRGIPFDFTEFVSNEYEQPVLSVELILEKGYYLVCNKLKMSFRTKEQQEDYLERLNPDSSARFNKDFNRFIRKNAHNIYNYLYLIGGNSKCGRFLDHFISKGMEYEVIPNILVEDQTINLRIPLYGLNASREDVQFLAAKYSNTYAIQNIPITELCGGMTLPYNTAEKYNTSFYMPPARQVLVYAVINTLRYVFDADDDYQIFKKTMAKIFRQFEKGTDHTIQNEFTELLLLHPNDRSLNAKYIEEHLPYIGMLLKIIPEIDFIDKSSSFYGFNLQMYQDAYSATKTLYKRKMQFYENKTVQEIIASGKKMSKWTNEANLYTLVVKYYPDAIYQYHADRLGLQSLDIYIPSLHIGIEYQGLQHYEPVSFFGGIDGFRQTQERDKRKAELCRKIGINLIYWRYDEAISLARLRGKLKEANL